MGGVAGGEVWKHGKEMSISLAKYAVYRYPACYAASFKLHSLIDKYKLYDKLKQTEWYCRIDEALIFFCNMLKT